MRIDHDIFSRCYPGYNSDRLRGLRYFAITFYSLTTANADRNDHTGTRPRCGYATLGPPATNHILTIHLVDNNYKAIVRSCTWHISFHTVKPMPFFCFQVYMPDNGGTRRTCGTFLTVSVFGIMYVYNTNYSPFYTFRFYPNEAWLANYTGNQFGIVTFCINYKYYNYQGTRHIDEYLYF